jgi:DNA-binding NarL/FixJ family response regulator
VDTLLVARADIEVVGETADCDAAVRLTKNVVPDVVWMDIRMPGCDGLVATQTIVSDPHLSQVRVMILTTFALDDYRFDALRAGASGFLLKDTEPADLVAAVRTVASGDALISPAMTRLMENLRPRPNNRAPRPSSTSSPSGSRT